MKSESVFEKKKSAFFYTLAIGVTVFAFTACNQNKTTNSSTSVTDTTAVKTAIAVDTNQLNADWEKFRADADQKLKQHDDSLEAIKKKLAKLNKEKQLKYEKHIADLQSKNDSLKARLHNFRIESKEKWENFKAKFSQDMDSVSNPLHDQSGWNE